MMQRHKSNYFAKVIASDLSIFEKIEAAPFAFAHVPFQCETNAGVAMQKLCESEGHTGTRHLSSWNNAFSEEYREKVRGEILTALRRGDFSQQEVTQIIRRNRNMIQKYMMEMLEEGVLVRYRPPRVKATTPYKWRIA